MGASTAEEINETVSILDLDMVQVGLFSNMDDLKLIKNVPIIKEIVIQNLEALPGVEQELKTYSPNVNSFILNFDKNGISWDMLQSHPQILELLTKFCKNFNILISIISKPNGVVEIMKNLNPFGFNFVGGTEEKVGFKSFEEMDEIFDLLEIEE